MTGFRSFYVTCFEVGCFFWVWFWICLWFDSFLDLVTVCYRFWVCWIFVYHFEWFTEGLALLQVWDIWLWGFVIWMLVYSLQVWWCWDGLTVWRFLVWGFGSLDSLFSFGFCFGYGLTVSCGFGYSLQVVSFKTWQFADGFWGLCQLLLIFGLVCFFRFLICVEILSVWLDDGLRICWCFSRFCLMFQQVFVWWFEAIWFWTVWQFWGFWFVCFSWFWCLEASTVFFGLW